MSLYSCDFDGYSIYRERISVSDGTVKCCESGIIIPAGQPYAECQLAWSDEIDPLDLSEEEQEEYFNKSAMPQCIEVWRLLRRNNFLHGACAPFRDAINSYHGAIEEAWPDPPGIHVLRYRELLSTMKRAAARYAAGRGPKLHPSEQASLESREWVDALPWSKAKPKAGEA